jgi:hypothetical protein
MEASRESEQLGERLATIRERLARMREESRVSLARLAATLDAADDRAAARAPGEDARGEADRTAAT